MNQYIGKFVQLIYIDRKRQVSIRDVKIISVKGDQLKAYCFAAKAYRIFNINNIVDVELIKRVI
ncbi:WYL domain-containing protein [Paenibacillus sp. IITD108]|uniref:WYL domain-containing protein n=1 Tax=Paenibacillus sp. IITD108 TaxID=3116649 RepID=UPI002F425B30